MDDVQKTVAAEFGNEFTLFGMGLKGDCGEVLVRMDNSPGTTPCRVRPAKSVFIQMTLANATLTSREVVVDTTTPS
jgi:hypothetical protein